MPKAKANNIELEYETYGDPSGKPFLLVMGLGAQMIRWDVGLIEEIVKHGFYVIIFDNRDIGLSTKFEDAGTPNVMKAIGAAMKREKVESPYLLKDMADDAVGLLDALGIEKAHICGASIAIYQTIHQALCSIRDDRIQRSSDFIPRRRVIDRNTRICMD